MRTEEFLSHLKSIKEVEFDEVEYKLIDDIENEVKNKQLKIDRLPFIKRYAFRDELEYRIICGKKYEKQKGSFGIKFEISIIERIVLSNSLPYDLREPMVKLLKSIPECEDLTITRSTLNENKRWKRACERAR